MFLLGNHANCCQSPAFMVSTVFYNTASLVSMATTDFFEHYFLETYGNHGVLEHYFLVTK